MLVQQRLVPALQPSATALLEDEATSLLSDLMTKTKRVEFHSKEKHDDGKNP